MPRVRCGVRAEVSYISYTIFASKASSSLLSLGRLTDTWIILLRIIALFPKLHLPEILCYANTFVSNKERIDASCACLFSRPAYGPIARLERDQRRSPRIGPKERYLSCKEKEMEFKHPKQGVSHLSGTYFLAPSFTAQNPRLNKSYHAHPVGTEASRVSYPGSSQSVVRTPLGKSPDDKS